MAGLLQDKVAVVTGAGKGIGRAIAEAYASEGAKVVVSDLDAQSAEAVAASLDGASSVACDVREDAQVKALVDAAVAEHGRLDIMVPNAGVATTNALTDMTYEEWRSVLSCNLDGVFLCIHHAAPAIIASGGGSIVNMCSITAQAAAPLIGHYAAAKAGVMSLTQTAAIELRDHGVRVNAILPGFVGTDMVDERKREFEQKLGLPDFDAVIAQKQGRYGTPEEVARMAVFVASDRSRFSNGTAFVLDGGARASVL